ncbi:uridine kinase [Compostibacillus humi]|uniref:Uridine kinase n=1 Tax=Compostibacillus humi TaxID=1245525 RepID=A0A8J2ZPT1_9BACI|nr:uridine kinase [Compostibacillus humi]GGH68401.1 uridine kinase [Compostibacillus humi]HLT57068.1 uridine kinase [Bacillota bacterium]
MKRKPVVIGVAGGSGSGKTSVTRSICRRISSECIVVLEQDDYYKDQSHLSFEERLKTNYDHPSAFDNDLLIAHLQQLINYQPIYRPVYDYTVHTRREETVLVEPKDVIIVEGILVLGEPRLTAMMDMKVFVDTDADIRIIRRILRDTKERGRNLDSVIRQYVEKVRPSHIQFVEPTKKFADVIIPEGGENAVAIDMIASKIESVLGKNN